MFTISYHKADITCGVEDKLREDKKDTFHNLCYRQCLTSHM